MKKKLGKKAIKFLSLPLALSLVLSTQNTSIFAENTSTITIYHTNDMHGSVEALANVKTLKDNTPNSLLVDAGDATQGSSLATYTKGEAIIDIMNKTGYDIMTLGNHEFDFGSEKAIENVQIANFPVIAANVINAQGSLILNRINNGNGAYVIKNIDGRKIGIFGLTTEETSYKTNPNNLNGVTFDNVIKTAKEQVALLQNENVDAIIAVVHIGNDTSSSPTSIDLAKEVPEIDLIIDGHSHTIIQEVINDVTVVQTGSGLSNLGKVTLNFTDDDLKIEYELLDIEKVIEENSADEVVADTFNKYYQQVAEILQEVVGNTTSNLYAFAEDGTRLSRLEETPMGSLIADAMIYGSKLLLQNTEYNSIPIVSLQNGGGVRAGISSGDITLENILDVLPFGNLLSIKLITPDKLYNALENGVSKIYINEEGNLSGEDGRFPQIGGMRIEVDLSKPALDDGSNGERVSAIYLIDENGNETFIDKQDTKTQIAIASNDFTITGGDGYDVLTDLKLIAEGQVLDEVVAEYIKLLTTTQGGSFSYEIDGNRIKIINTKQTFKPIYLSNFLYLRENKEVNLYNDIPETTPSYWANESIYYLKALDIFEDNSNLFYPNKNVTYSEFSKMLEKLLGLESADLKVYGLLQNEVFENDYILKREDVAFIIGNALKAYNVQFETKSVSISEEISHFAIDNFNFLAQIGILNGDADNKYNPQKNITKAELSVILYNVTNLFVE